MKASWVAVFLLALTYTGLQAQSSGSGITLRGQTQHTVTLTWQAPVPPPGSTWPGCTTDSPCVYQAFSLAGQTCPTTVPGSSGWQYVGQTSLLTLTDNKQAAGTVVSYVVYAIQNKVQSDPSNCVTVTLPNNPGAATNLAVQ